MCGPSEWAIFPFPVLAGDTLKLRINGIRNNIKNNFLYFFHLESQNIRHQYLLSHFSRTLSITADQQFFDIGKCCLEASAEYLWAILRI